MSSERFYLRYYVGQRGRYARQELLEIELRHDGKLRYVNKSNDEVIRRDVTVTPIVIEEFKRIIKESGIMVENDKSWPEPDRDNGKQELEIVLKNEHISFMTTKLASLLQVQSSSDPEGLKVFYYLVQDIKKLATSLMNMHFKARPIS